MLYKISYFAVFLINGTVFEVFDRNSTSSDTIISEATVTLMNLAGGPATTLVGGTFRFPNLPAGNYSLTLGGVSAFEPVFEEEADQVLDGVILVEIGPNAERDFALMRITTTQTTTGTTSGTTSDSTTGSTSGTTSGSTTGTTSGTTTSTTTGTTSGTTTGTTSVTTSGTTSGTTTDATTGTTSGTTSDTTTGTTSGTTSGTTTGTTTPSK